MRLSLQLNQFKLNISVNSILDILTMTGQQWSGCGRKFIAQEYHFAMNLILPCFLSSTGVLE